MEHRVNTMNDVPLLYDCTVWGKSSFTPQLSDLFTHPIFTVLVILNLSSLFKLDYEHAIWSKISRSAI